MQLRVANQIAFENLPVIFAAIGRMSVVFSLCLFPIQESPADDQADQVRAILSKYCYACHGDGGNEGGLALDELFTDQNLQRSRTPWWAVLKNVRAEIMPPVGEPDPTPEEKQLLADWIKTRVFQLDPEHPDPGRVTLHRLNRTEYRNTIRDLTGVDFDTTGEFPPDDTGYGFDNISDVLSISPLLLEKYLVAARTIVEQSVPTVTRTIPRQTFAGDDFRNGKSRGERMSFYEAATVRRRFSLKHDARYRVVLNVTVAGGFDFDPGRCQVAFAIDDEPRFEHAYKWESREEYKYEFKTRLSAGEHSMSLSLNPLTAKSKKKGGISFRIDAVHVEGPLDRKYWEHPNGYERYFHLDEPPAESDQRKQYAREVLRRVATRAFRRPINNEQLDRLVEIAQFVDQRPNRSFEEGIAHAVTAILSSPRFLFRVEQNLEDEQQPYPLIDEYALASRLSYLFWSTMPDDELFALAERGELRANLDSQIERMLQDERSEAMIDNFVGQWLQSRDVESVSIDPLAAFGFRQEYDDLREHLYSLGFRRRSPDADDPPEIHAALDRLNELREIRAVFDRGLRTDMRRETEMMFEHIVKKDRSVLDLIDADYAFLNEQLAKHYGVEGVDGDEMRLVKLPSDSPRGGVLTQGTFLMVTSNPTRTSPVKRGLFVLDNILGTPAPPPPANVPELESAKPKSADKEPTLRELLEIHRSEPLCSSCHSRFDPLGLALENFNAIGVWRDQEHGQDIDPSGALITGESFRDIFALKAILKESRRQDFYRCLAERFLTYALGRGLEYYDQQTLDDLVRQLNENDGRFSALLKGVIQSAPFQRQRRVSSKLAKSQATKSGSQP